MSTFPQISEAEFEVMKIVWKYASINTNEITEKLLLLQTGVLKQIQLYKTPCDQRRAHIRKTKSCICLYSCSKRR